MEIEIAGYLLAFSLALVLSLIFTPIIRIFALRFGHIAHPNEIRWHKNATPSLGGVAIFLSFLITFIIFNFSIIMDRIIIGLLLATAAVFFVGLIDDLINIKPYSKVVGQILASCLLLLFGIHFEMLPLNLINLLLTIFWLVGITNAFNLLDNMDGLASGVAFISSSILFIYSLLNNMDTVAILSIILAGASLGFLRYNFNPAKIFMGDAGSMFLGFSLAAIAVIGTARHVSNLAVTLVIPILILGVPIFDTIFVAVMRTLHRQPVTQGGKDHTSHRLVILGLSEKRAVLLLYLISILFGLIALFYSKWDIIIVSILAILTIIILFFFGMFLSEVKTYSKQEIERIKKKPDKDWLILNTVLLYKRRIAEVLVDLILICISYYTAHLLRFEGKISPANLSLLIDSLPWLIILRMSCFFYFGLYRGVWRYVGIHDLVSIFKAVSLSSILTVLALTMVFRFREYSRVVFIIDWLLSLFLIAGVRVLIRLLREYFTSLNITGRRILIMGAGDAGEMALREIRNNKALGYQVIGFIDDDLTKVGKKIHGMPILGTRYDISELVKRKGIEELLIAIPSATEENLKEIFESCKNSGIPYKKISGIMG